MQNDQVPPLKRQLVGFLRNPVLVREHGTWAILIIPLLTGFLRSHNHSVMIIPLFLAFLFLFFAYHPFEIIIQYRKTKSAKVKVQNAWFWFLVWFTTGSGFGLYAVISSERYSLFLFALTAIFFFALGLLFQRKNRISRMREFLGILALALGAPAVLYYMDGDISERSVVLWILNTLFFLSSSFFVHLKMMEKNAGKDESRHAEYKRVLTQNAVYQSGLLCLLLAAKYFALISSPVLLAFLPMIVHCLYAASPDNAPISFKKVGFTFLAYSVFFGIMFAL